MGFAVLLNNVATTLGGNHTAGATTLDLATGYGATITAALAELGETISASTPLRVTVVKAAAVNTLGQITDRTQMCIFQATGLTSDQLTGVSVVEGRTDLGFATGDMVGMFMTAGMFGDIAGTVTTNTAAIAANTAAIALKAPLASPALTGVPTAPTAANGTNTTQIATTAFVLANAGGLSGSGTGGKLAKWSTSTALTDAVAGTDHVAPGGVSGGQTIKGGTAASNNLTLFSTAHATLGNVYLNGTSTAYIDMTGALIFVATADVTVPTGVAYVKNYASGNLLFGCATGLHVYLNAGPATVIDLSNTGGTGKFGVFGAAPVARPTVSGSRGGNAALASLLTALASLGWITDSTTA